MGREVGSCSERRERREIVSFLFLFFESMVRISMCPCFVVPSTSPNRGLRTKKKKKILTLTIVSKGSLVSPNKNRKDKGDKVTKVAEGSGIVLLNKLLGAAKEGFFRKVVFLEGELGVGRTAGLGTLVGFGGFYWFGGLVDHFREGGCM